VLGNYFFDELSAFHSFDKFFQINGFLLRSAFKIQSNFPIACCLGKTLVKIMRIVLFYPNVYIRGFSDIIFIDTNRMKNVKKMHLIKTKNSPM